MLLWNSLEMSSSAHMQMALWDAETEAINIGGKKKEKKSSSQM